MTTKYNISESWLRERYVSDVLLVEEIASQAGCSVANIRRLLKKWKIKRGKIAINLQLKPSWNKGLTKETDERLKLVSEKTSGDRNGMFGRESWNKGLTKETDERLAFVSKAMTGREVSEETRQRQSKAKQGKYQETSNAWKGGYVYNNGYGALRLTHENKRVYRHRYEAQVALKRELTTSEHVHHIDRNKQNNSWSNLIVLNEVDHNRLHRAIEAGFDTVELQVKWLKVNNVQYEYLKDYENQI